MATDASIAITNAINDIEGYKLEASIQAALDSVPQSTSVYITRFYKTGTSRELQQTHFNVYPALHEHIDKASSLLYNYRGITSWL